MLSTEDRHAILVMLLTSPLPVRPEAPHNSQPDLLRDGVVASSDLDHKRKRPTLVSPPFAPVVVTADDRKMTGTRERSLRLVLLRECLV